MAHIVVCDHAGCGRTGFDCDGSWYRVTITATEDTTVWYCSPYCLIIDTLGFDGGQLSHPQIIQVGSLLQRTADTRLVAAAG